MVAEKFIPKIGTKLYLHQRTGDAWVDMCKYPYTVIGYDRGKVLIQQCKLIFNGPRYYDTLASAILEDPHGEILALSWAPKKGQWQIDKYKTGYPEIAVFGSWEYQPYLN